MFLINSLKWCFGIFLWNELWNPHSTFHKIIHRRCFGEIKIELWKVNCEMISQRFGDALHENCVKSDENCVKSDEKSLINSGDRIARSCRYTVPDLTVEKEVKEWIAKNLLSILGPFQTTILCPEIKQKQAQDRKKLFETVSLPVA